MTRTNDLPSELRALVRLAVAELGEVIKRELGTVAYRRVENIRQNMAALREKSTRGAHQSLVKTLRLLEGVSSNERFDIAHSFGLMLELMNACENAYRTFRLSARPFSPPSSRPKAIVYVLTAHPTEARTPATIAVFHEIQGILLAALKTGFEQQRQKLRHYLEVAWRLKTARVRKPSVEDEAEHVYSILLRDETLIELLSSSEMIAPVYVRSWVGGDKDGHPGVTERTMINSLSLSRKRLIRFIRKQLSEVRSVLRLLSPQSAVADLARGVESVESLLSPLAELRARDGNRLKKFHALTKRLLKSYERSIGATHPALARIDRLLRIFPGLVVPLELREASDVIVEAARGKDHAITRMLSTLAGVSSGCDPRWYARGFVVSSTSSLAHVEAAIKLLKKTLGGMPIPVVPLFEFREALENAPQITSEILGNKSIRAAVAKNWDGQFEVMVGYSDSAKEIGVLPSRLAIAECLNKLDAVFKRYKVAPVYFHGSGGSVDRGGGSIQEQTAWWPKSALQIYKATVQGEMIERTFASPEILRGGLEKIAQRANETARKRSVTSRPEAVLKFAGKVSKHYQSVLKDPSFLTIIQCATAYRYLSVLRIGSRPSKRSAEFSLATLRAIPWVLSWTQTRVLFPTWWGVGAAWKSSTQKERVALKRAFEHDPLLRSYVKLLGFTLAKVEMPVWRIYLEHSGLDRHFVARTFKDFEKEYADAVSFVRAVSGEKDLLWFRPWLGMSIKLRSPMIHPLNLLQILGLQEGNSLLIRETVTGIASGMMTTG